MRQLNGLFRIVQFDRAVAALRLPTLAGLLVLMVCRAALGDDSLDSIRRDVRQADEPQQPPDKKKDRYHGRHDHDHQKDETFLGSLLSGLLDGLLFGGSKHHHHHDHQHDDHDHFDITYHSDQATEHWTAPEPAVVAEPASYFAKFPYADGLDGYMMQQTWVPVRPQTQSAQLLFQYGSDFDRIDRYTGSLLWESTSRWGLDSQWNYYTEKTAIGTTDDLHVGDANLLWRILETDRLQARVGAGLNWLSDSRGNDFGVNFTLRSEAYPLAPFIISSEAEWGTLGNTSQFHGAVSLGAAWRRVEFFSGYDYRKIGSTTLAGPQFGLRVWY